MDIPETENTKLFYFEELKDVDDLKLLKKNAFKKAKTLLLEIKNSDRKSNLIKKWDELFDTLAKVFFLANFFKDTHPLKKCSQAAEKIFSNTVQFIRRLYDDQELYGILKDASEQKDLTKTEPIDDYALKSILRDFETTGLSLHKVTRKKVVEVNGQIKKIALNYKKGKMKKKWWQKIATCRCFSSEEKLLYNVFRKKLELAHLFGFPTYADFALQKSVANTYDFVQMFLKNLSGTLKSKTFKELNEINHGCHASVLNFQEISAIKQFLKNYLTTDFRLKAYFLIDACIDGLKVIFKSLYDVTLEIVEEQDIIRGELWPADLKKYCVREQNEIIGYIYCDFLVNKHKSLIDQCFLIQGGRVCDDGSYQKPVVVVSLNVPQPDISQPILLDALEVNILFHEMGHAMFFILGSTKYLCVGAVQCPVDLAEVPSRFMEYFATDSRIIHQFAKHYETQEVIPPHLIEKHIKYNKCFNALLNLSYLISSEFDQACHSIQFLNHSISHLTKQFYDMPTEMLDFTNLVQNHGAFLYRYLMCDAIASTIWHKYFQNDPLCHKAGKQFRSKFLALTGLQPPRDLVENYLQIKLTPELLSDSLMKNL